MTSLVFFFFNDTATTEIYTLSLHDALPIFPQHACSGFSDGEISPGPSRKPGQPLPLDRKSTRLNSSHANISYAVFCLKKKKSYTLTCFSSARTINDSPAVWLARRHAVR